MNRVALLTFVCLPSCFGQVRLRPHDQKTVTRFALTDAAVPNSLKKWALSPVTTRDAMMSGTCFGCDGPVKWVAAVGVPGGGSGATRLGNSGRGERSPQDQQQNKPAPDCGLAAQECFSKRAAGRTAGCADRRLSATAPRSVRKCSSPTRRNSDC